MTRAEKINEELESLNIDLVLIQNEIQHLSEISGANFAPIKREIQRVKYFLQELEQWRNAIGWNTKESERNQCLRFIGMRLEKIAGIQFVNPAGKLSVVKPMPVILSAEKNKFPSIKGIAVTE